MEAYKKVLWISTIVVILLIIPLIIYFFLIKPSASSKPMISTTENLKGNIEESPASKSEFHEENKIIENTGEQLSPRVLDFKLNNSDESVRQLIKDCSTHPDFQFWLKQKDILRRSVAIIDNIANGISPSPHLHFLIPKGQFKVIRKEGNVFLDPTSYIRYQPFAMVVTSIDSEKLASIYKQLLPLLEEAYGELGYPGKEFQESLEAAIEVLLKTPVIENNILLEEKVTSFAFADPHLEGLNDVQKHLLRMGPENIKKIKTKLKEILTALEE